MTYCKGLGGDPYINLALGILRQAKEDDENKYPINKNYEPSKIRNKFSYVRMWRKFIRTDIYKHGTSGSLNSLEVASWVVDYITGEKNVYKRRMGSNR